APEIRGVAILSEVLPQDEVVRPGRGAQLELGHVHRLAVRGGLVFADLALAAERDGERRHAHLESARRRPVEMHALGIGRCAEDQPDERDHPEHTHGHVRRLGANRMSTRAAARPDATAWRIGLSPARSPGQNRFIMLRHRAAFVLAVLHAVPALARCPAEATTAGFLAPGPYAVGVRSLTLVDTSRQTPAHAPLPVLLSR